MVRVTGERRQERAFNECIYLLTGGLLAAKQSTGWRGRTRNGTDKDVIGSNRDRPPN